MPKVSEEHRESRRDQIAAAALRCFVAKGFHRTSMADIIAESGLSAGAIYLHFDGKRAIALDVGRRVLGRRRDELDALSAAGAELPPARVLRVLVGGMAQEIGDTRILLQLWSEATLDPEMGRLVMEIFAELGQSFTHYLGVWASRQRGMTTEEAAAWATLVLPGILALGQGFVVQRALLPGFDQDAYFAAADELLAT